ncbi:signal transducer [Moniliophthora roreri MCA 2997]|uniref:Signal transducer n=1 Tax=Moniliophthora roreri (strain MCA 2997) TaxID=1381753 RepID=V2WXT4_MONRO|nr:signal transducer [Moniliophthora roreri MCA 2997]
MSNVDTTLDSTLGDEQLSELFDKVWVGYGAGPHPRSTPTPPPPNNRLSTRSRSYRPLPPTPGQSSSTSSPISTRQFSVESPSEDQKFGRQLPRPVTNGSGYFVQSPMEEAPQYPFPVPPPPPPVPQVNRSYVEDTPEYTPSPAFSSHVPDSKSPAVAVLPPTPVPPPPPLPPSRVEEWQSPGASGSGSASWSPPEPYANGYTNGYTNGHVNGYDDYGAGPSNIAGPSTHAHAHLERRPSKLLSAISAGPGLFPEEGGFDDVPYQDSDYGGGSFNGSEGDEDPYLFVNYSLLSHIAVQLKDKVPRGTHVKGSIPYPRAFTGKDIVSTIQSLIQRELAINHNISTSDRRAALQVARSLQSQLFFYEVEWGGDVLQDGVEDVYMFLDDMDGPSEGGVGEKAELPTGVVTALTKCYTPDCVEGSACYSPRCPKRGDTVIGPAQNGPEPVQSALRGDWLKAVPKEVLVSLPESEINRQTIIHKLISKEEQYIQDLDVVETMFIRPLRQANPPIISSLPPSPSRNSYPSLHAHTPTSDTPVDSFIDTVFSNILDLRECNKRLLEVLYVRQREQSPVIQRIGDIFLDAATEFRIAYPIYIGGYVAAEKRLREEAENNTQWRMFVEQSTREVQRHRKPSTPGLENGPSGSQAHQVSPIRLDLKHYLNRPIEHLQKYPVLLEAILNETVEGNPDAEYLQEAIEAIRALQGIAQLRTFQTSMGRGPAGKWEWFDLVGKDITGGGKSDPKGKAKELGIGKTECKRQSIIFELIKGEMGYVKDLENIDVIYVRPLRNAEPPIIPPDRIDQFINDVFHNFNEVYAHHRRMLEKFHEIQREEHPVIKSITAAVFDAALNFRDAYLEYVPNYPIAEYRIDEEMARNPAFKKFVEDCTRHPEAHRLDMKNFINRPIPRLLRYELLLKGILDETPPGHEDREDIPQVLEVIKALGKDTEPGVVSAKQKVELWRYNSNIVFKPGEWIDMDLLDENRSLIHTGKLLRQPEGGLNGWSELFVLLFDNYLVMTKAREKDGVTKFYVNRRPIPLDLLTLVNFTDPPTQRGAGLLRNLRGERHNTSNNTDLNTLRPPDNTLTTVMSNTSGVSTNASTLNDARSVFPCTIHHNGRMGGAYILYAESAQVRAEWKNKLEEAMGLRRVVQESNKVFEIETLSTDTFLVPPLVGQNTDGAVWSGDNQFTGKVTCSVPFNTPDGRGLVAIGCAEGVWIGFRHDSRSMRRVLHLKMVTQCAMLEDFGIFLVLADKSLFAYHIEALVPSSPASQHASQTPQKLSGNKDVHFFSVGTLQGRTLVVYMKRKSMDSIFYAVEPVIDKIKEVTKASVGLGSRLGFRTAKSDWFRPYREFFLPSESFDLIFLKAKIAILCTKGFEIMDLSDLQSVTIPQKEDPRFAGLAKRCESCRPLGMFRSTEDEFLLCYNEFGLYVNKRGEPSRPNGLIEWEGTAERVALHSPYILLFDTRFIEIRHVQTGRLAQIICGNDVHCLWDGRGTNVQPPMTPLPGQDEEERMVQEPRVHGVMNVNEPMGMARASPRAQHVFELIPTIPLYLPGSLASPTTNTYFPQSYSPPHSPTFRPMTLYRS